MTASQSTPSPSLKGQSEMASRPVSGPVEKAGHSFRWLRYVPHQRVSAYEAQGWINRGFAPGHFAVWAVVMAWPHQTTPPDDPS